MPFFHKPATYMKITNSLCSLSAVDLVAHSLK